MTLATVTAFRVTGSPVPQGSLRAFVIPGTNRAVVTNARPTVRPWRALIVDRAERAMRSIPRVEVGPVVLRLEFILARPVSLPKRVTMPATRPDLDKLTRAALDALTGVVFRDDGQVVGFLAGTGKRFAARGESPGLDVLVAIPTGPA